MPGPIDSLIDSSVYCGLCGSPGLGTCDCFEHCSCGWWAVRGKRCGNPKTTRCTTKVKYGEEE